MRTPSPTFLRACLMAALFSFLPACSGVSTKPDVPHYAIPDPPPVDGKDAGKVATYKPDPPKVDCQQPAPPDSALPAHPRTSDPVAWSVWSTRVYGYVRLWFNKDRADRACIEDLRKAGVIR